MLLEMLVLLDSILKMQLFQINQSEDSSKITIMSDTTCVQLHQRPITSASNYNRITLSFVQCFKFPVSNTESLSIPSSRVLPAEAQGSGPGEVRHLELPSEGRSLDPHLQHLRAGGDDGAQQRGAQPPVQPGPVRGQREVRGQPGRAQRGPEARRDLEHGLRGSASKKFHLKVRNHGGGHY